MPGPAANPEVEEVAKRLGVTKGYARVLKTRVARGETLSDLSAKKLLKLDEEIKNLELKNKILEGKYIPVAKVREDGLRAGSILKAELAGFTSSLPPLLSGLTEPEMRSVIEELCFKTLSDFCLAIERINNGHSPQKIGPGRPPEF